MSALAEATAVVYQADKQPEAPMPAVVVVSYNTRDYLRNCLASVLADGAEDVVVVDNASTDGTREMVHTEFPQVRLVANVVNLGFGPAANQGIAAVRAEYVVLLNADTLIHRGALRALASHLHRFPNSAVAGPRLLYGDGTFQRSHFPFPTPGHSFLELVNIRGLLRQMLPASRRGGSLRRSARSVPWVLGAVLGIRRSAFQELGGFDESFFIYHEDIDLCYRLRRAGWDIHYAPAAVVTHLGQASTRQHRRNMLLLGTAGRFQFYRKHYSAGQSALLCLAIVVGLGAKIARDAARYGLAAHEQQRSLIAEDIGTWLRALRSVPEWAGSATTTAEAVRCATWDRRG